MATPQPDTYTVAAGVRTVRMGIGTLPWGSVPAAGVSRVVAIYGDSLTEHSFGATPWYAQMGLLGAPLQIILNGGISGLGVGGLLAQLAHSWLDPYPGLAGIPNLGWVAFRIGTNYVRDYAGGSGAAITAGLQQQYSDIITALLAANGSPHVIVFPVPPIGGVTTVKNTQVASYNTFLQSLVAANPTRLHWIDDCSGLTDGSGNIVPAYFDSDELHFSAAGATRMALTAESQFAALFANQGYTSPLVTSSADVYPAQPQWNPNPTNIGTGGSLGSGWTGQAPNGYTVYTNGSGYSGTVAVIAADVGDANQAPWMRITPTSVQGGSTIGITFSGAGRALSSSDPYDFEQCSQIRFVNFDGTKLSQVRAWMQAATGGKVTEESKLRFGGSGLNRTFTLQQKYRRLVPSASGAISHYIYIEGATASFSGSMGSIDIRCISVRG